MKTVATADLDLHPQAGIVPSMRANEFAEFVVDVRERGIRVPLELIPGTNTVIDGRQRLLASKECGLEQVPVIDAHLNGDDPVVYMIRAASKRRNITDDQRAMLANEEREWLAKKAKKERAKAGRAAGGKATPEQNADRLPDTVSGKRSDKSPHDRSKESRTQAAKSANVPERKVRAAATVAKHDPKLAAKVKAGEVTLAQAAREVHREQKRIDLEAKAAAAPTHARQRWSIIPGDCVAELKKIDAGSVRLIFADPPYNIGVDYGKGAEADKLDDAEFLRWCSSWISLCVERLAADGSLWLMIGDEYADHFGLLLRKAGLHRRAWIKWYETFGVNQSNNFNRCSRHIFYCVRDRKKFVFNAEAVNRPSDRQTKYGDKRADAGGKIWDDVWQIPRLVGTAKERIPDFPTQLPLELVRAIVGCASEPGDLVLDPFSGSATTGVACVELGRQYVGIEKSLKFAELSKKRLKGAGQ